ncbi:amidohydrolase [Bacillus sp. JJ722]|uniref:amidohydrolase n=1 Tax=Bacillus sp. JJ722 TaxID=3122973 RepID=UPI002FFD7289
MLTKNNKQIIFTNGKIFTSNMEQPYASAMIVEGGKIKWIGEQQELNDTSSKQIIDLKGRTVLPGFIDAHCHPILLANCMKQVACTKPLVNSIEEMKEQIHKKSFEIKQGEWIEGWGYDEGKLKEGRAPTRWDIDAAVSDIPVVIRRSCEHIISVNSKALELAGITKDTVDPLGGKIDRDKDGEPTGILRENAKELVRDIMPKKTLEEEAAALVELSKVLLSKGITAITELMALKQPIDYMNIFEQAKENGWIQRTVLYYIWNQINDNPVISLDKLNRDNRIHIGGIKLFSDGSVSGQTAWVRDSYIGTGENCGIQMVTRQELLEAAEAAKENHIQLVIHAMGDQAIDLIIDIFLQTKSWLEEGPSIRIEHFALPTDKAIKRVKEANIAVVTQPIFQFAEIESYLINIGLERTQKAYPVQSLLSEGVQVAFSSDAPATAWSDPVNPFVAIQAAVTRNAYDGTNLGHDECIDVQTAIHLYTEVAQKVTRIPAIGQLKEGYHADFIVLDEDIFEIDPATIHQMIVEETYMGGQLVYQKAKL